MLGFLEKDAEEQLVDQSVVLENATIIPPCFIAKNNHFDVTTAVLYVFYIEKSISLT